MKKIKPRDRDEIIQSLRAGVVPKNNQHRIQVGRTKETEALVRDVQSVTQGGSTVRFVIGDYGSGKTFFLNLIRSIALEKNLVTAHAELAPDRLIHAARGQARSLYAELIRNLAIKHKPDGGAVPCVLEQFVTESRKEAKARNVNLEIVIHKRLAPLHELPGGYDFADVVAAYWRGVDTGNEQLKSDAVRWVRGEFQTKADAKSALGVGTVVDNASVYDFLKLVSCFVVQAGFGGFLICIDEMVNLYKLSNSRARNTNYEQLLRIINDTLQGGSKNLAFIFGGTPDFLTDTRRGLYSHAALRSRLSENTFAAKGLKDYSGPVLRLENLTPTDCYTLLRKIRDIYAYGNPKQILLPDKAIKAFINHCSVQIGDAYFRTPRSTVVAFVDLLAVLEQNPHADWRALLDGKEIPGKQENRIPHTHHDKQPPQNTLALAAHASADELVGFVL